MSKWLAAALILVIAFGSIPYARSLGGANIPPGISEKNWVPMGQAAGFVVTGSGNDLREGLKDSPNVMKGYFMIYRKGVWARVDPTPAADVQRL
jgi:hypothetical protein